MNKKKLTLYCQYYHPEVASLSQLCTDLCEGLTDTFDVTVICSVPCYTGTVDPAYTKKKYYFEEKGGVKIIRVKVPPYNKQNKLARVRNILAYFFRSLGATFKAEKPDFILTESQPPILGGLLGVLAKRITALRGKRARLLYVIQDYNPEQTMVVGYSKNRALLRLMMSLDKHSCRVADKVVVVGADMLPTMTKRFTNKRGDVSKKLPKTVFINNWMDENDVYPLPTDDARVAAFRRAHELEGKFVLMYSGNIGLFYDLENLFAVIERFKDDDRIVFPFVGEGTKKAELMAYAQAHGMKNVVFIPYQKKEELAYSLNAADAHWIVNAEGVKGVSCPSKLYGILAVAKPALAVLEEGTEARGVIEQTRCGYAVSPRDYDGVAALISRFLEADRADLTAMGARGHQYMREHLTRDISIRKYRAEILDCEADV